MVGPGYFDDSGLTRAALFGVQIGPGAAHIEGEVADQPFGRVEIDRIEQRAPLTLDLLDGRPLVIDAKFPLEAMTALRDAATLQPPAPDSDWLVVLGAAWLGKTRLIDNIEMALGNLP